MRKFDSGATRDDDEGKPDLEGFLSPLVLERFAEYMTKHRKQADGKLRPSDNWQDGIPLDVYMKSAWRHFHDWWRFHRGWGWLDRTDPLALEIVEEALCALMFNVMGYLHEHLKARITARAVGLIEADHDARVAASMRRLGYLPIKDVGSLRAPDRTEEEHGT